MAKAFQLTILTPKHTFFEGKATLLSFETDDGRMGVMAGHEPLIVPLVEGVLRLQTEDGKSDEAAASSGFATILPDRVDVLLQTAEWGRDIDALRAKQAAARAEEALRQKKSMQEYYSARTMLARAMVRLRVTDGGHETK